MNIVKKTFLVLIMLWSVSFCSYVQAIDNISELQYFSPDGKTTGIVATTPVTMLVIFKPECKDCQLELPLVQKIAKEYSEKLNVTLIVYGKQSADIAEYVKQFQDFSNISVCADPEKLSKTQFAIRYVPCIVLFDAKGKLQDIIQTDNGIVEQSKIEIAINRYLPVLE